MNNAKQETRFQNSFSAFARSLGRVFKIPSLEAIDAEEILSIPRHRAEALDRERLVVWLNQRTEKDLTVMIGEAEKSCRILSAGPNGVRLRLADTTTFLLPLDQAEERLKGLDLPPRRTPGMS